MTVLFPEVPFQKCRNNYLEKDLEVISMRVEKEVTKLTKMHTEMRITVSIDLDIKQMLHKRENIATKKTRVKHYIYFAFSLN